MKTVILEPDERITLAHAVHRLKELHGPRLTAHWLYHQKASKTETDERLTHVIHDLRGKVGDFSLARYSTLPTYLCESTSRPWYVIRSSVWITRVRQQGVLKSLRVLRANTLRPFAQS
jgi:hypothetical protein